MGTDSGNVKGSLRDRLKTWRMIKKAKRKKEQEQETVEKAKKQKHYNKAQVFFLTLFGLFLGIFESMADRPSKENKISVTIETSKKAEIKKVNQLLESLEAVKKEMKESPVKAEQQLGQVKKEWIQLKDHPVIRKEPDVIAYTEQQIKSMEKSFWKVETSYEFPKKETSVVVDQPVWISQSWVKR